MRHHCCLREPPPSSRNASDLAPKPDAVVLPFPVGGVRLHRDLPSEVSRMIEASVSFEFQLEDASSAGRRVCVPFLAFLYADDERKRPSTLEEMMYGRGTVAAMSTPVVAAAKGPTLYDGYQAQKKEQKEQTAKAVAAQRARDRASGAAPTAKEIARAAAAAANKPMTRAKARAKGVVVSPSTEPLANPVIPPPAPSSVGSTKDPASHLGSSHREPERRPVKKKARTPRDKARRPVDRAELIAGAIKGVERDQRIAHSKTLTAALHVFCPGSSKDLTVEFFVYAMIEGVPDTAVRNEIHRALGTILGPLSALRRIPPDLKCINDEDEIRQWRGKHTLPFFVYEWKSPVGDRIVIYAKDDARRRAQLRLHAILTPKEFAVMLVSSTSCCTPPA